MQQDHLEPQAPPAPPAPADLPVSAPVAPAPERHIDPEYVARLEQAYREQQAELNRYEPIRDDVNWMLEDETRRSGIKKYREAFESATKPEVPEVLRPLYDRIDETTKPLREYVDEQKRAAADVQAREKAAFFEQNQKYAARLKAEKKLDDARISEVAAFADALSNQRSFQAGRYIPVGIEEAYKTMAGFSTVTETPAEAPVLRGDAGAIGVPGNSTSGDKPWLKDFHGWMTSNIEQARRSA